MSTADAPLPKPPHVPGPAPAILVVQTSYYKEVAEGLLWGARQMLDGVGAAVDVLDVAGALELPQAIRIALRGPKRWDGFVALGCVVRGGTDHYEYVCRTSMDGLMQVALQFGLALGTGLLTVHSIEQGVVRSGRDGHNKGAEAAAAALLQVAVARRVESWS
jgi:6,7-dimethyl-8-ribityllumazine synthase